MFDELSPSAFMSLVEDEAPQFAEAYRRLSLVGECDDWGGMESKRVYHEWIERGRPGVEPFIRESANKLV